MLKVILLIEQKVACTASEQLARSCRKLHTVQTEEDAGALIMVVDAAVIHAPAAEMLSLQQSIARSKKLPIFWYNSMEQELPRQMDWGYSLDGLLFPSMTSLERTHALSWGLRCFQQRKRWAEERDSLLQRIEERKWIDQAKAVLCEIKGISESEAYDFLRKQAMNERKRIGEVAANIVKVYQLIHG